MFLWKYPTFFNVCSNFGSLDESHLERRKATCHFKTSKPKLENKVEVSHPPQSLVVLGMQTTLWERAGVDSCKDEGELGGQPLKYSLWLMFKGQGILGSVLFMKMSFNILILVFYLGFSLVWTSKVWFPSGPVLVLPTPLLTTSQLQGCMYKLINIWGYISKSCSIMDSPLGYRRFWSL